MTKAHFTMNILHIVNFCFGTIMFSIPTASDGSLVGDFAYYVFFGDFSKKKFGGKCGGKSGASRALVFTLRW